MEATELLKKPEYVSDKVMGHKYLEVECIFLKQENVKNYQLMKHNR